MGYEITDLAPAQAGQGITNTEEVHGPLQEPPLSSPAKANREDGITVDGWTLRWEGDSWTVGQWRESRDRRRWRNPSWYGRLDHALRGLLARISEGDVSDLEEAVRRVESCYEQLTDLADGTYTRI